MFQPWFVELTSVISNFLVGISAIIVAVIGIIGLKQWRYELSGKTKFEIARNMAKLANQFKDEFLRARNPFTSASESVERVREEGERPELTHLLDEYFARNRRLLPLQETLKNLYAAKWEADVILEENTGELIQPLENGFKSLYSAIHAYFGTQLERARSGQRNPGNDEWMQSNHRIIYSRAEDELMKSINSAVDNLLNKLKTHIK